MVLRRLLIVAGFAPALVGCQAMPWMHGGATASTADVTTSSASQREGAAPESPAIQQAASFADPNTLSAGGGASQASLNDEVLAELQVIGAEDPAAAQMLIERLQSTKESLRPLVARQFRTSWQYHRELAAKNGDVATATGGAVPHMTQLLKSVSTPAAPNAPISPDTPPTYQPRPTPAAQPPGPVPTRHDSAAVGAPMVDDQVKTAVYEDAPKLMPVPEATQAEPLPVAPMPRDWRELAAESIARLASQTADDPRSTADAYQHVRLRLMQLAAGQAEHALEPVPGLTPTEQTYWSNQLFALSTLLDHEAMPDEEQRAGLAESQLAEALGRLGELSNLSVRNLTFCQKVYGYGDHDKTETARFKPGEAVTLYAEVGHYRSESTEKGHHTSLATSYEILDQAGNRVDGGEFATVDDYCGSKRNDFYIEYTIGLPDRIYASHYQLRVLIRDRLSGKIGKSTIGFEIAE